MDYVSGATRFSDSGVTVSCLMSITHSTDTPLSLGHNGLTRLLMVRWTITNRKKHRKRTCQWKPPVASAWGKAATGSVHWPRHPRLLAGPVLCVASTLSSLVHVLGAWTRFIPPFLIVIFNSKACTMGLPPPPATKDDIYGRTTKHY